MLALLLAARQLTAAGPPLHFETALFAVDLRPGTFTIEALRPRSTPTHPTLSFTAGSTAPRDRRGRVSR